jgi:predicted dehydrogenase
MARRPTVALCGAGMMARVHATAATLAGAKVVAVASRSDQRRHDLAERVGAKEVDLAHIGAAAGFLVVATPPDCHHRDALGGLEAGAAVMVETPLCTTLVQADDLINRARRAPGRLFYAENLAYAPVVGQFWRLSRHLGALTHLEVRALTAPPSWGERGRDDWGGGVLFDLGCHLVAIAIVAAGADQPRRVRARLEAPSNSTQRSDDHAVMDIEFASGLVARLVASWRGSTIPIWDVQAASATGVVRAEIHPEPSVEYNGEPVAMGTPTSSRPTVEQYGYRQQWSAFIDHATHGSEPAMGVAVGAMVLDLICAAYWSARTGDWVATPFGGPRDRTPLELWRAS